ncbi:MAG: DUF2075 domain-containing protein [Ignavibacteria bacterium]|nr:DUF2075 domain-containing protein [Ignavibacteria bacterium]
MRLYSGIWSSFHIETTRNQIAEMLRAAYRTYYGHEPSVSESTSWRNSLSMLDNVGTMASLNDHGILLEYQLPLSSKRLDAMITGYDRESSRRAVVIELKQWERCRHAVGANQVITFVGGREREVNHPSAQVQGYVQYLTDVHTAFQGDRAIALDGCGFLHNYDLQNDDVLQDEKFTGLIKSYPLFGNGGFEELASFLGKKVGSGGGSDILNQVEQSKYRPSKKLMMHVAETIDGQQTYVLLDEQRVIYDKVFALVKHSLHRAKKQVVVVKGGPGTGKSVIALNLMAQLSRENFIAHYATGSKSFTETLRAIVGTRAGAQFKYFNSYMNEIANTVDVLICDEAHRIRSTSNNRFTRKENKSIKPQLAELINVSKVLVLFIDDYQMVRPDEIGSIQYVLDHVSREGGIELHEYELTTQFRCGGSEAFIDWVNDTLGIVKTTSPMLEVSSDFEFKICSSPKELDDLIREKLNKGFTARMMAGYCWPWSNPKADGTLVDDIVIGDWERPWNAKPNSGRLATEIPPASLWAYQDGGQEQVGCIYTAQGFEFDFAGVIIGPDLTYDLDKGQWQAHPNRSSDGTLKRAKDGYLDYAKNLYRVLLTRGMKGCYVHFVDKETERFVRSRMR